MQPNEPTRTDGGIVHKPDGRHQPGHTEAIRAAERAPEIEVRTSGRAGDRQLLAEIEIEELDVSAAVTVPADASEWLVALAADEIGRELDHLLTSTRGRGLAATPEPEREADHS